MPPLRSLMKQLLDKGKCFPFQICKIHRLTLSCSVIVSKMFKKVTILLQFSVVQSTKITFIRIYNTLCADTGWKWKIQVIYFCWIQYEYKLLRFLDTMRFSLHININKIGIQININFTAMLNAFLASRLEKAATNVSLVFSSHKM